VRSNPQSDRVVDAGAVGQRRGQETGSFEVDRAQPRDWNRSAKVGDRPHLSLCQAGRIGSEEEPVVVAATYIDSILVATSALVQYNGHRSNFRIAIQRCRNMPGARPEMRNTQRRLPQ